MGREDEARTDIREVLEMNPRLSLAYLTKMFPYKNKVDLDKIVNDPRKAGLN
jgi:hypothetical protein